MGRKGIKKYSEIRKNILETRGRLSDLVDETFLIVGAEKVQFFNRPCYVVEIERGGEKEKRHTFSNVLIKQLEEMKPELEKGYAIEVTLRRRKRYYTFE